MRLEIITLFISTVLTLLGLLGFTQLNKAFIRRKLNKVPLKYEKIDRAVDNRSNDDVLRKL